VEVYSPKWMKRKINAQKMNEWGTELKAAGRVSLSCCSSNILCEQCPLEYDVSNAL
jgi:hypothetical protein